MPQEKSTTSQRKLGGYINFIVQGLVKEERILLFGEINIVLDKMTPILQGKYYSSDAI